MRRLSLVGLFLALTSVGACSLINAPGDVVPGGTGGAGPTTTSTSTSATSTSTTGGGPCTSAAQCAKLNDACNVGACDNGSCVKKPAVAREGKSCDDGLFCTENDVCMNGACAGTAKVCGAPEGAGGASGSTTGAGGGAPVVNGCHVWSCNETLNACELVIGQSGSPCDDGDPCTLNETCAPDGTCGNGVANECKELVTECSGSICTPGVGCGPVPQNEGGACDVANTCATSTCKMGKCSVVTATNTGSPCDDKAYCTVNETCLPNGSCGGGGPKCVTANKCAVASCDEAAQTCMATAVPVGEPCEDGDVCTGGETCDFSAFCGGGGKPTVYFSESFDNNSNGWTLGQEWQIGAAMVSVPVPGQTGADPGQDHTQSPPGPGGGVAGIVIGGNEDPVIHPAYYIESPAVDVSAATGKVVLTYYRWLNSDYTPYMKNLVEVFDGSTWNVVWETGDAPGIQDSPPIGQGWTFMSHDITMFKNAGLKVRFGYEIDTSGVYTVGSWNLDDVKIQNTPCGK